MARKTAEDWRDELLAELAEGQEEIHLYDEYYKGNHRLQFATSKFKEAFGELFAAFATNWCGLVVDVAAERLSVQGFRFGEDEADMDAWRIWQANGLDRMSLVAHTEAIKLKHSFLLVGPPRIPGGEPTITVEHPSQCIVRLDPADRRRRLAGLKVYRDHDGSEVCVLYLPDKVHTWRRDGYGPALRSLGLYVPQAAMGDWRIENTEDNFVGVVRMIPLENNGQLLHGGMSDLKPAIALNDAANKFFTDMIHASEYTSFPQRVATGVELPRDPITGQVSDAAQIRAAVSRLWAFEAPDATVTSLPAGDLSMFVEGVDLAVQHMAAQTRTPPHYLLAKLANVSGDALVAAETGLEHRCRRKHLDFSDPWEEAMRLSFAFRALSRAGWAGGGDDEWRATLEDAETIWADPANRDPVSLSQSLTMKRSIGVPEEILWEEAGYTPQQIERMKELRAAEREAQAVAEADDEPAHTVGVTSAGRNFAVTGLPAPGAPDLPAVAGEGGEA